MWWGDARRGQRVRRFGNARRRSYVFGRRDSSTGPPDARRGRSVDLTSTSIRTDSPPALHSPGSRCAARHLPACLPLPSTARSFVRPRRGPLATASGFGHGVETADVASFCFPPFSPFDVHYPLGLHAGGFRFRSRARTRVNDFSIGEIVFRPGRAPYRTSPSTIP